MKVLPYLGHKHLYNTSDTSDTPKNSFSKLNGNTAILLCASINFELFLNQKSQLTMVKKWFNDTSFKKISAHKNSIIFFREQILIACWYIINYCSFDTGFKNGNAQAFKSLFAKGVLLCSDVCLGNEKPFVDTGDLYQDSIDSISHIRKILAYSNHLDINSNIHYQYLYRGHSIFVKYFDEFFDKKYQNSFIQKYGVSLEDFYTIMFMMIDELCVQSKTCIFNLKKFCAKTKIAEKIERLISRISIDLTELKVAIKSSNENQSDDKEISLFKKTLREKPIVSLGEYSIVLDLTCLIEFMDLGPVFVMGTKKDNSQERFGFYGKCFEKYVVTYLNEIFPGSLVVNSQIPKGTKKDGNLEIDAHSIINHEIFLIETKGRFIRDEGIFLEELEKKYGAGVDQLNKIIELLINIKDKNIEIKTVFPILIVRDPHIDFTEFLLKQKLPSIYADKTIYPLIIIPIDILEILPEKIDFRQLLLDYFDFKIRASHLNSFTDFVVSDHKYSQNLRRKFDITDITKHAKELLFE